jgi:starch synthase
MNPLKILIAASEVVPFAKTGGLADVVGVLPKALHALGHDVRVVMPRYYGVDKGKYRLTALEGPLAVPMGTMGTLWAEVYEGRLPNSEVPLYFIEYDAYFGRSGLYDDHGHGYEDNDLRFVFFSHAVMALAQKIAFHPDVIHVNDWHTAAVPALLNTTYAYDPHFAHTGSMLTIHNLQHQGHCGSGIMDILGIGWNHFGEFEQWGGVNLLKGGMIHADVITTVSAKYAQEIRTPEFGWGLEGVINAYGSKLHGILNGVDYEEWSPAVDTLIPHRFDVENMSGKAICKAQLQQRFGLPQNGHVPVIGFVGRLAEQKGIALIASAIHRLLAMEIQIVMLGSGEPWAERFFTTIAQSYPHKLGVMIGYDNTLSHHIEAGSDLFLMPSLFEPCGLNQIYSLRYGTLPIVRATGGLDDTIENYHNDSLHGTGFKFTDATEDALVNTVGWAVHTWFNDPSGFATLQRNAMQKRFDWKIAAQGYERLYYAIVAGRKG